MVALSLLKKLKMSKLSSGYFQSFFVVQDAVLVCTLVNWERLLMNELLFDKYKAILAFSDIFLVMMAVLGIPLYPFLIYPFLYNYIPTMLKRIGFGLLLLHCSFILYAILGNMILCSSQTNVTCLFSDSKMFNISSTGLWWILFPTIVYYLGVLLPLITLAEFVFAQTPHSIRGFVTGMIMLSVGFSSATGIGLRKLAYVIFPSTDNWFSSHMALAVASAEYLILCVFFSKRYKLRIRDDIVPIHLFAEEYFEKELEGRRRLDNERLQWQMNISVK